MKRHHEKHLRLATGLVTCMTLGSVFGAQQASPELQAILSRDVGSAADHPLIGRYESSVLIAQSSKAFDEVLLPTAAAEGKSFERDKQKFKSALTAQGRVTRSIYFAPPGRSSLEVTTNFIDALTAKGFKQVFTCAAAACGESFPMLKYSQSRPATQVVGEGYEPLRLHVLDNVFASKLSGANVKNALSDLRYTLLKKPTPQGDTYVSIYGARHGEGMNVYARALSDRVGVLAEVVEPRAMEQRMVVVKAADIGNQIAADGRAVFYGILFDFDKADIKPESTAQLTEMAKFLQGNPAARVFIVGHTDSKGALDYNVDLSNRRAAAVVKSLAASHGIDTKRLVSRGLGPLAPVASNRNEEGRARNRRVELVEQ
jgi:OmpA-OmpF porin, OOP family